MENKKKVISIVIIISLLLLVLTNRGCKKSIQPVQNSIDTVIQNADKVDHRFDSIIKVMNDTIYVLNTKISVLQSQDRKIVVRYQKIHDTINKTPDINDKQFIFTKLLCPSTGDSIDLKQINLCLEEGNEAINLLPDANKEIALKDSLIKQKDNIINEVYQENDVKETVILKEKSSNDNLTKDVEKQIKRKKFWRNATLITTTIAIVFGIIIF